MNNLRVLPSAERQVTPAFGNVLIIRGGVRSRRATSPRLPPPVLRVPDSRSSNVCESGRSEAGGLTGSAPPGWGRTNKRRSEHRSLERILKYFSGHVICVEIGLRESPGGAAVPLVVGINDLERLRRLFSRREAEHPFTVRQEGTRSRVLDHHGLAAGEITERTVADPGRAELHVGRFRAAEFSPRALNVCLVLFGSVRDFAGLAYPPSPFFELPAFFLVFQSPHKKRKLQRLTRQAGHPRKLQEGDAFRVFERIAVVHHPVVRIPIGNRAEDVRRRVEHVRPLLEGYGGVYMVPPETAVRNHGPRSPDGFPDGKVKSMTRDSQLAPADPELEQPRVYVDEGGALEEREKGRVDGGVEIE